MYPSAAVNSARMALGSLVLSCSAARRPAARGFPSLRSPPLARPSLPLIMHAACWSSGCGRARGALLLGCCIGPGELA